MEGAVLVGVPAVVGDGVPAVVGVGVPAVAGVVVRDGVGMLAKSGVEIGVGMLAKSGSHHSCDEDSESGFSCSFSGFSSSESLRVEIGVP